MQFIVFIQLTLISMMEQVAWNKSSLLLRFILQNTQTLQLFTTNIKTEGIYKKLLKITSSKAWVGRPGGILKEGWSAST